jgi:hypothetical protein
MDERHQDRASVAVAERKRLAPQVTSGLRDACLASFAGSVSAPASVKLTEAFAKLIRQIPAGCGSSIAAYCFRYMESLLAQ